MKNKVKILFLLSFGLELAVGCNKKDSSIERQYYESGELNRQIIHLSENKDSVVSYYKEGKLKSIEIKNANKKNGQSIYFFLNGNISGVFYFKEDVKQGSFKTYHENGKLRTKGQSLNGEAHGVCFLYNSQGELIEKNDYK